ncbi:MAG: hypothetical protein ACREBV_03205 [Candidatus Zixiibacteriota bacterium]
MNKIKEINRVIEDYFNQNNSRLAIMAKDLMANFIESGIFEKDHRNGLPIRNVLRDLDRKEQLYKIPSTFPVRRIVNTNWIFINLKSVLKDAGFH